MARSLLKFLSDSRKTKKAYRRKEESTSQSTEKKLLSKLSSNIGEKAHLMVKKISWRKDREGEDDYNDDDNSEKALWRKTIMMGERCRPLNFSGKIDYDSRGNLVPESLHRDKINNKSVPLEKC